MLWDEDASLPLTANVWGTKNTLSLTQDVVLKFRSDVKDTLFCHFIDYLSYHSGIVYGSRSGCMGSGCNSCQELLYIAWVSFRGHHWLPWSLLKLSVLAGNETRPHLDILGSFVEYFFAPNIRDAVGYCTLPTICKYLTLHAPYNKLLRPWLWWFFLIAKRNVGRSMHYRMLSYAF